MSTENSWTSYLCKHAKKSLLIDLERTSFWMHCRKPEFNLTLSSVHNSWFHWFSHVMNLKKNSAWLKLTFETHVYHLKARLKKHLENYYLRSKYHYVAFFRGLIWQIKITWRNLLFYGGHTSQFPFVPIDHVSKSQAKCQWETEPPKTTADHGILHLNEQNYRQCNKRGCVIFLHRTRPPFFF